MCSTSFRSDKKQEEKDKLVQSIGDMMRSKTSETRYIKSLKMDIAEVIYMLTLPDNVAHDIVCKHQRGWGTFISLCG